MTQKRTLGTDITCSLALCFALSACGSSATTTMQTVSMTAVANSGQSGTATLTDLGNGSTSVTISTVGGTDTASQTAHIHIGTCGSNGPVFVALTNVQGGGSTTTVPFTLSALAGGTHYINIHNSANAATIQVCGQIK